jgi:hypothetical protein
MGCMADVDSDRYRNLFLECTVYKQAMELPQVYIQRTVGTLCLGQSSQCVNHTIRYLNI